MPTQLLQVIEKFEQACCAHIHGTDQLPEYITIMHGPVNVQHTKVALFVSIYVIQG